MSDGISPRWRSACAVPELTHALDPGGHIDHLVGLVQRRSLFQRLMRPVFVVVSRVHGEDLPEVPFAVD